MPIIDAQGAFSRSSSDQPQLRLDDLTSTDGPGLAVTIPNDTAAADVQPHFAKLALITIEFPSFADGRGFSLAKRLRAAGFGGRLHACGHLISDQLRHAMACGFDAIEIDDALAARQPESVWREAATQALPSYQQRLRMTG